MNFTVEPIGDPKMGMLVYRNVLNKELGQIRIRFSPSCDYYYYELFLIDGSRSDDDESDEGEAGKNGSQNQASRFSVKNSLSPLIPNTIQFVFKNQILERKQLSANQANTLISLLKELSPRITLKDERKDFHEVVPCVFSALEVESWRLSYSFSWSNSDDINFKKQLKGINNFVDLVQDSIVVDFSKLDMPRYL